MSGEDYKVAPRSWDEIARTADTLRIGLRLSSVPYFPIMDVLERVLDQMLGHIQLEVGSKADMGIAEGHTCPKGEFIELREDVYEGAWAGNGRARFTAAHELGHLILHSNAPLARARPGEEIASFRRSEPQANQFAAELLMPPRFFTPPDTAHQVAQRHGVSLEAARNRLQYLRNRRKI